MNYNDEFESLIKNFKLDDAEDEPDYAAPPQRPQVSEQARGRVSAAPSAAHPTRDPRREPPAKNEKDNFHVKIEEDKVYTQSSGGTRPPRKNPPPVQEPPEDDDEPESVFSGINRWMKAVVVVVLALGAAGFLAIFALNSASDLFGLNKEDKPIEIELLENQSMAQVAAMLKENGVITQQLTFQLFGEFKASAEDFVPGTYALNSNMSYDQIMLKFRSGTRQRQEVSILFIEGLTLREIAEKLEKEGVCTADELYEYLDEADFSWDFEFLKQVPEDQNRFRRFEGYLFPDTYSFYKDEDVRQVVLKFFTNFNSKINDEIFAKVEKSGMTLDQVLTLASIVQHEAATAEDMKMVSSVFHNRLAAPANFPKLQSDVTIFYVRDNIKPFMNPNEVKLGDKDPNMAMYDSYDTYVRKGLPVGPICNPGLDAINAVLEPEQSEYYYFIADKEGKCHYAKTLAEHQVNIQEAGLDGTHGTGTASSEAAG